MSIYETTIQKIRQLPESLVQEVNDYVDFLLVRRSKAHWELWSQFAESIKLSEEDFSSYLGNLEDYEARLARGEIRWE